MYDIRLASRPPHDSRHAKLLIVVLIMLVGVLVYGLAPCGVDFDATLFEYAPNAGAGEPVQNMVTLVRGWLEAQDAGGPEVRIFTARVDLGAEHIRFVHERCQRIFGRTLPITNVKTQGCVALYDDIAYRVEANTGKLLSGRHDAT